VLAVAVEVLVAQVVAQAALAVEVLVAILQIMSAATAQLTLAQAVVAHLMQMAAQAALV
jgi:hypothetical protein